MAIGAILVQRLVELVIRVAIATNEGTVAKFCINAAQGDEAASCMLDPLALVRDDPDAGGEVRFVLVGMSHAGRLLTMCYTLRAAEVVRLISARKATKKEERYYAQGI